MGNPKPETGEKAGNIYYTNDKIRPIFLPGTFAETSCTCVCECECAGKTGAFPGNEISFFMYTLVDTRVC